MAWCAVPPKLMKNRILRRIVLLCSICYWIYIESFGGVENVILYDDIHHSSLKAISEAKKKLNGTPAESWMSR